MLGVQMWSPPPLSCTESPESGLEVQYTTFHKKVCALQTSVWVSSRPRLPQDQTSFKNSGILHPRDQRNSPTLDGWVGFGPIFPPLHSYYLVARTGPQSLVWGGGSSPICRRPVDAVSSGGGGSALVLDTAGRPARLMPPHTQSLPYSSVR